MSLVTLSPQDLAEKCERGDVVVIDVRETDEFADGHLAGAVSMPLSRFNPHTIPDPGMKTIVFMCAHGMRSARAASACQQAGLPYRTHLHGGIAAWKAAGLPTER